MSADYFIYNGIDTRDFNAQVFRPNVETVGPQLYTTHEIPGRNGDILLPKGKYPNRRERYHILCTGNNAAQNMDDLKNALLYQTGYQRLTDSFDTDVYYQAALTDQFDIEYTRERDAAKCQISFNRMPQKFLVSGDTQISYNASYGDTFTLVNPTFIDAKPLITLFAAEDKEFGINDTIVSVDSDTVHTIDCESYEILDLYGRNADQSVHFSNGFPVLKPGNNVITLNDPDNFMVVYITPRWWKL